MRLIRRINKKTAEAPPRNFYGYYMRIDKFLKVSRILKRRTVAQEACSAGKVVINGKEVKPSHEVKAVDVVEILYSSGTLKFRVKEVKEVVKKDDAGSLYEVID